MIKLKFNDLVKEKEYREKRHLSLRTIRSETKLSLGTLGRMSNEKVEGITFEVLEALCAYFNLKSVAELLEYAPEEKKP